MDLYSLDHLARAIAEREVVLRLSVDRGRWCVMIFARDNPDERVAKECPSGMSFDDAIKKTFAEWDKQHE